MNMPRYTEMDGKVREYFELAEKAIREGKFDKAQAYARLIAAAQAERGEALAGRVV